LVHTAPGILKFLKVDISSSRGYISEFSVGRAVSVSDRLLRGIKTGLRRLIAWARSDEDRGSRKDFQKARGLAPLSTSLSTDQIFCAHLRTLEIKRI
jgi:hypothetical protein